MSRWTQNRRARATLKHQYTKAGVIDHRSRSPLVELSGTRPNTQLSNEDHLNTSELTFDYTHQDELSFEIDTDEIRNLTNDCSDSVISEDFDRYDDFESEEEEEHEEISANKEYLQDFLVRWQLKHKVTERAMDELLVWLKQHHFPQLPKTIKTLKSSAKLLDHHVERMATGEFCYFGLKKMLTQILMTHQDNFPHRNICRLQFGIDGVPLAKSSGSSFWPILVKITDFPDVLPIAVYHGISESKPPDVHIFLEEFVQELVMIREEGFQIGDAHFTIEISAFIMDAPAKSYVLDIKVCIALFVLFVHAFNVSFASMLNLLNLKFKCT